MAIPDIAVPKRPPLNGRNLAEFYTASETAKRSTLRKYAKPSEDQQAPIIMYDPVRRILPEYFGGGRNVDILTRARGLIEQPRFDSHDFFERRRKSNNTALAHLEEIAITGSFEDVRTVRTSVTVGAVVVKSTVDFYATFVPTAKNSKARRVAAIVNPSGIKHSSEEKKKTWIDIEVEVARRAAADNGIEVDEIFYIDLPKQDVIRRPGAFKKRVWAEIDATCERIMRDWRDIRLSGSSGETSFG